MKTNLSLLRYFMQNKKASQKTLCEVAEVSQTTMSKYFTGQIRFDIEVIRKISDYLDIPIALRGYIFLNKNFSGVQDLEIIKILSTKENISETAVIEKFSKVIDKSL